MNRHWALPYKQVVLPPGARPVTVNPLRVLLVVDLPLLRDALHTLLAQRKELTVVVEEPDNIDILVRTCLHRVDVLVATFESDFGVPPLVTHLLAEFPELLVVGINLREQRTWTYRNRVETRPVQGFSSRELSRPPSGV